MIGREKGPKFGTLQIDIPEPMAKTKLVKKKRPTMEHMKLMREIRHLKLKAKSYEMISPRGGRHKAKKWIPKNTGNRGKE